MNLEIKNILDKIEDNGYEAYVVGGYVRDYLLGINSVDVDICTNATPKEIIRILNIKKETISYGSINIQNNKYNFDITTYRKELSYKGRKPDKIEYINNLILDIERRDFTINSFCMNKDGKIFDFLNANDDLNNKLIRVIGDTNTKLTEDPLRILRAIRLSIILDFNLDDEIKIFIKNHKELIKKLSYTRKKEELEKIFSSKNIIKGLKFLKELDLLWALDINYDKIIEVPDILGIWAQINFSNNYPFTRNNINTINKIRHIIINKKIDKITLFKNGLYISLVAGNILGYDTQEINNEYKNLIIHSTKELAITNQDIINILNIKPNAKIKLIYEDILYNVINGKISNEYLKIEKYILTNWK